MCDQRESILDYLYDEVSPVERRESERHLEDCEVCRHEVQSLRRVREDLLAWDVPTPEQPSVWTAFAPAPVTPWYRQVPSWGMAAAASVVFAIGVLGGGLGAQLMPAGLPMGGTLTMAETAEDVPVSAAGVPVESTSADAASAPVIDDAQMEAAVGTVLTRFGYSPMAGATPVSLSSRGDSRQDPVMQQELEDFTRSLVGASEARQWEVIQDYLSKVANEANWQRRADASRIVQLSSDLENLRAVVSQLIAQQPKVQ